MESSGVGNRPKTITPAMAQVRTMAVTGETVSRGAAAPSTNGSRMYITMTTRR